MDQLSKEELAAVRALVSVKGAQILTIDRLGESDLALLGWSGTVLHIESVANALHRVGSGEVEYLVVRAPSGQPVAKGGVDFTVANGGKLWQLATHSELRSLGVGAHLIGALEARIRERGEHVSWLGVEIDNPRARSLYERLGYVAFDEVADGWESQDSTGRRYSYETRLTLMRRRLLVLTKDAAHNSR
jgi:ribosomal protein S18 acetylase RimI-like enzyme